MVAGLVRAWVAGWVLSRDTAPPVQEPWGLRVDVGLPNHVARHVLPDADETTVREVAGTVTVPGTWIKAFVPPQDVASWLGPDWAPGEPGWLMATGLRPSDARAPEGYRVDVGTRGAVTRVRVLAADGSVAAAGQAALAAENAVFDQVTTDPAHQRRGLGSFVMRTLANAVTASGATTGVLGATVEGRGLYESLGWTVHAPLAGFVYRPGVARDGSAA
ncbi:GNAT family N-acetyltransferase [Streptomyces sp. NBC_01565]|uniref:GNAT family N-acetyltransferase n=1 Tax=unclassified Streptomyces TaxID=2593676 RepID=UPI0022531E35|nr:GNAT family N-acetyltransferase [Streptomyces sp. NBC_01565]MCX4545605.1 GNAT family N-acetyltransferase [Streptomyces sp. NBC_01565]